MEEREKNTLQLGKRNSIIIPFSTVLIHKFDNSTFHYSIQTSQQGKVSSILGQTNIDSKKQLTIDDGKEINFLKIFTESTKRLTQTGN